MFFTFGSGQTASGRIQSKVKAVALVLAASLASFASAQDAFDNHVADMEILQVKAVQAAIGLTEAERGAMNTYAQQYTSQITAYRNQLIKTKGKPDGNKVVGFQLSLRTHVLAKLSAAQLKRLAQISLQHDGVAALADDVVAKKVGLSAAQVAKIRQILVTNRKRMQQMETTAAKPILEKYKTLKPKNEQEGKALTEKFQKEMRSAALKYAPQVQKMVVQDRNQMIAVLTAPQKNTWNGLLGKPFTGK